jgi:hypothetical protein
MTALTKQEFWAELEAIGETEVRVRLQNKIYSDLNEKGSFAREWILRRELAAANVSNSAQSRIARSAKNTAWIAAIAAIIAAIAAMLSVPNVQFWISGLTSSAFSH